MQKGNIAIIDFLDVFADPLAGLVESLRIVDDSCFEVSAVVVLLIKFVYVLAGDDLVIEDNGILIGSILSDDLIELIAFVTVDVILVVIVLLCLQVLAELLEEEVTLALQLIFVLAELIGLDALQVDEVDF
jgi:hypothetical protein